MAEQVEVHHHQLRNWLLLLMVAFIALVGLALSIQRPSSLSAIPFFAPTATPTPLASQNITVTSPKTNDQISQLFTVSGRARVFENVVIIRLKEKLSGKIVGEIPATTNAQDMGQYGDFNAGIQLSDPNLRVGTEFVVEVFQYSAKDGKEIDKVSIPVTFAPTAQ